MADGAPPSGEDDRTDEDVARAVQTGVGAASAVAGIASAAASGGDAGSIATSAVGSAASVAGSAVPGEVGTALGAGASALQAGQGIAAAAESGDAAGAVGGAAGAAGGLAGAAAGGAPEAAAGASEVASGVGAATSGLQAVSGLAESLVSSMQTRIDLPSAEFLLPEGPEIQWTVERFLCAQELSAIYEIRLDLLCVDVDAPLDEMLGAPCELEIERGELEHAIYGIVEEVEVGPIRDGRLNATVRVVPAFALLTDAIDTRVFQGQTVPEILTDVLTEALEPYGREVDTESFLQGDYNRRDYCVQFRESTFAFCSRLMEEEGIAYFFAPDAEGHKEKLVLIDNNADYAAVDLVTDGDVPIIAGEEDEADRESIQGITWRKLRTFNKVTARGYNLKAADAYDEATEEVTEDHNHQVHELYLHDDRRQIIDDTRRRPAGGELHRHRPAAARHPGPHRAGRAATERPGRPRAGQRRRLCPGPHVYVGGASARRPRRGPSSCW